MIDIRALETFQKLAGWLTPLFFTAALMAHCQMLDERYIPSAEGVAGYFRDGSSLYWLLSNQFLPIQIVAWGVILGTFVVFIAAALLFFEMEVLIRFEVYLPFPFIGITGVVCLLAGIFFIASLLMGSKISSFNPFWHLGLLCYGFDLLDTNARVKNRPFP